MATKPTTAAVAKPDADETDNEKKALFGGLTDEQRADMSDEELEGIDGDDDEGEDEADADGSDADDGDDKGDKAEDQDDGDDDGEADGDKDDDDDDKGGDDENGASDGADVAAADDAGGDDEAEEDEEEDVLDVTRSVMPNEWQLPKDADDQLKALTEQGAELAEKFDAGDLTAREYHQQRDTIDEQRSNLRMQIGDAKKAWGKAMTDWSNRTVKAFLREHKEYDSKNPTLNRMLDGEVRALQLDTNDPFNPRILRKAHANIQTALGKAPASEEKPGKTVAKPAKDKTPLVPGKKPQVPPTLARVPQDQIEEADDGKYARLHRLETHDPHAFEEAFSRLKPSDRDAYLAGA